MTGENSFSKTIKMLLILVLSLGYVNYCICQQVEFRCYIKSVCNDSITLLKTEYSLQGKDTAYYSHNGICLVSKPGEYNFNSMYASISVEPIVFKVSSLNDRFQSDTLQIPELFSVIIVRYGVRIHQKKFYLQSDDWVYCGNKANGYKVDYYRNGQKRIDGVFKNGKPIDMVNYYNEKMAN